MIVGFCIGVGEGWLDRAKWAIERMEEMTGIRSEIFEGFTGKWYHPSWGKLEIAQLNTDMMIFDADILPMKPWNPEALYEQNGKKMLMCRDVASNEVIQECKNFKLRTDRYFNGGLIICGPHHKPIFDRAAKRHPQYGSWLEQTALNEAIQHYGDKVIAELPRAYNTLLWPNVDDLSPKALKDSHCVNMHAASLNGDWRKLKAIQDSLS